MKNLIFLWSLLLLFVGVGTLKAQVEPQISTDETVYEYYMTSVSGKQLKVYSDNDSNVPGYDSNSDRARVKIVKAGTDDQGDFYHIFVTNYDGHTSAVGTAATDVGTFVQYSGNDATVTNITWRKKQKEGDTDCWYFSLVADDDVALTAYGSKKIGLYDYVNHLDNEAYRWKFYPANAKALGFDLDIESGYYKIEAVRSGQTGTYLKNNMDNNNVTNRGNGSPLTNNYIWKVDVDDIHVSLLNGQGSPLKVSSTTYPTFDLMAKGAEHTYAFSMYLHCNNYGGGIQIYSSGGTDQNNQWKFVQVTGTPYEVVLENAPEGATITRTVNGVEEKALHSGFFLTAEETLDGTFKVGLVDGYIATEPTVDEQNKTVTVIYTALSGDNLSLHNAVVDLTALVEAAVPGSYVNCHPQTAIDDALAAIGTAEAKVWAGTATEEDVAIIEEATATFNDAKILWNDNGVYMFVNTKTALNDGYVMLSQDSDLKWGAKVAGKNSQYWMLIPEGSGYKVKNGDGSYMYAEGDYPTVNKDGSFFSMTVDADAAAITTFTHIAQSSWLIKIGDNRVAHANGHGGTSGEIISYGTSAVVNDPSAWKLLPVQPEYNVYTVIFGEGAPVGATITRTAGSATETAVNGGFFLYETAATPSVTDFTVPEVAGRFVKIVVDNEAKTITVKYERPIIPTTIEGGNFAEGTQWYVLQITQHKYYVTDNGTADRIKLTTRSYGQDREYWCFVANEDGSYKIYNKATGVAKVLASSSDMTLGGASDGAYTYPTLQEEANLPEGYVDSWDFSSSTSIDNTKGWYLGLHGHPSAVMNDNANRNDLAFWTGGKGMGSTFIITPVESETSVSLSTGSFNGTGNFHNTWTSADLPGLTFSTSANNMMADNADASLISCFVGSGCTYTLTAPAGYLIKNYSFTYKLRSNNESANVTLDGVAATTTPTTLSATDYNQHSLSFTLAGENKGITLSDFHVVVSRQVVPIEESFEVLPAPYNGVVHRIPAIAQAKNGNIIAVADYRYSGQDIGMATGEERRLDLHFRLSSDYGKTWGEIGTLAEGQGAPSDNLNVNNLDVAFGDPCIVVDRESGRVLVMSCAGNVSFPNGTRDNHQYIVTMYSDDNGATWSTPVDVSAPIYAKFDASTVGTAKSMFVGSGKISQSKYIKVGQYYRIYCAVLYKDVNGVNKNYVLYSDDFGATWDVLGGVDAPAIPSSTDEPKADELPDGSVVCSGRVSGGRNFNIFHYTDPEKAEGSWGTSYKSTLAGGGPVDGSPQGTNGEILTVPVKRKADGKKMFLFLQSVPLGPNRSNVAIYYKGLESLGDFDTPEHLAKDWDGYYQACYFSSAYSTMTWLDNNTLGFLYEEDINGSAYSIVYKNYTIEKLTDDVYEYCVDVDESTLLKESMSVRLEAVKVYCGPYVGNLTAVGYLGIQNAYEACMANPTKMQYAAFNKSIEDAPYRVLEAGREYRVRNRAYSTKYLSLQADPDKLKSLVLDENSAAQKLTFSAGSVSGTWKVKGDGVWLGSPGSDEAAGVPVQTTETAAADYEIVSNEQGISYFRCLTPANASWPGLHDKNDGRVVRWVTDANASNWYIEPVTPSVSEQIGAILVECMDELALAGKVGAPAADHANTETFTTEFVDAKAALLAGTATQEDLDELIAARTAYKSETDLTMPVAGKAYRIKNVKYHATNPTYRTVYMTSATAKAMESGETSHGDAEVFICAKDANGRFTFFNPKYGSAISCIGVSEGYDGYYTAFELISMNNQATEGNVLAEPPFGSFFLKTIKRRDNNSAGSLIANQGSDTFRDAADASGVMYKADYSSVYVLEEAIDPRTTVNVKTEFNGNGFYVGTYSNTFATVVPEGVEAYAVTASGTVATTQLLAGVGQAIPAGQGVLLKAVAPKELTPEIMLPATIEEANEVGTNLLAGTGSEPKAVGGNYILAKKNDVVGLYKASAGGGKLAAYRAYLPMESGVKSFRLTFGIEDGELTGIEDVEAETPAVKNEAIYDLSGRVVRTPQRGSLYIKGGKKFIQK